MKAVDLRSGGVGSVGVGSVGLGALGSIRAGLWALAAAGLGLAVALGAGGCASTGIAIRESFGQAKREQLVARVEDARDEQEEAKAQFATTLEEFKSLTGFDGAELEKTYNRLNRELERSRGAAGDVSRRVRDVERVGNALFKEWEGELEAFTSQDLRLRSERQLLDTRRAYDELLGTMKRAEASMAPVLAAFGDQVLFLKHNLNARAIASLDDTLADLEGEIERLIGEMNASIEEADAFIRGLGS